MKTAWQKVSRKNPCPICQKPDWCCIGDLFVNCMRIASDKPCHNGGYLHRIGDTPRPSPRPEPKRPTINATRLWSNYSENTPRDWIENFATHLGVSVESLVSIGCVWAAEHRAWAFPMRDGYSDIVGIRLRDERGNKWAVTGSRQGLFIPNCGGDDICYITEGPTDTAAGLTMGLLTIGRPSCSGCVVQTVTALRQKRIVRAIIVSDNDGPGLQGAQTLAAELKIPSCLFIPPCKDLREFLRSGGSSELIHSMLSGIVWTIPTNTQ